MHRMHTADGAPPAMHVPCTRPARALHAHHRCRRRSSTGCAPHRPSRSATSTTPSRLTRPTRQRAFPPRHPLACATASRCRPSAAALCVRACNPMHGRLRLHATAPHCLAAGGGGGLRRVPRALPHARAAGAAVRPGPRTQTATRLQPGVVEAATWCGGGCHLV